MRPKAPSAVRRLAFAGLTGLIDLGAAAHQEEQLIALEKSARESWKNVLYQEIVVHAHE